MHAAVHDARFPDFPRPCRRLSCPVLRSGQRPAAAARPRIPRCVDRLGAQHRLAELQGPQRRFPASGTARHPRQGGRPENERRGVPGAADVRRALSIVDRALEPVAHRHHGPLAGLRSAGLLHQGGARPRHRGARLVQSVPRALQQLATRLGKPHLPQRSAHHQTLRLDDLVRSGQPRCPRARAQRDHGRGPPL